MAVFVLDLSHHLLVPLYQIALSHPTTESYLSVFVQTDTLISSYLYPYYFDFSLHVASFLLSGLNADFKPAESVRHFLNDVIIYKVT